jgi:hypothetical protein
MVCSGVTTPTRATQQVRRKLNSPAAVTLPLLEDKRRSPALWGYFTREPIVATNQRLAAIYSISHA